VCGPSSNPAGWGKVSYEETEFEIDSGVALVVRLPHLSRFRIFGRPASQKCVDEVADRVTERLREAGYGLPTLGPRSDQPRYGALPIVAGRFASGPRSSRLEGPIRRPERPLSRAVAADRVGSSPRHLSRSSARALSPGAPRPDRPVVRKSGSRERGSAQRRS
jgi:hypothetical protein